MQSLRVHPQTLEVAQNHTVSYRINRLPFESVVAPNGAKIFVSLSKRRRSSCSGEYHNFLKTFPDNSAASIEAFVRANVKTGTTLLTDGHRSYPGLTDYRHDPRTVGKMAGHIVLPWISSSLRADESVGGSAPIMGCAQAMQTDSGTNPQKVYRFLRGRTPTPICDDCFVRRCIGYCLTLAALISDCHPI